VSKFLGFSRNGGMIKVEDKEDPKGYIWYFLSSNVKNLNLLKQLKTGDDVELRVEEQNGEPTVVFLTRSSFSTGTSISSQKTYGRSPEEQDSIKKQAIMKASADAVATALQGQVDIDTLGDQIIALYNKLLNKINE